MRSAAINDDLCFANAFARRFQQALRPECRLQHKDRIAALCLRFDELARTLAANLFIRGPQKDDPFLERGTAAPDRVERKQRLHDARLHIENAGAINTTRGDSKWHFGQRAGAVDRIVMAENQELRARSVSIARRASNSQMRAAMLLLKQLDVHLAFPPFLGNYFSAGIGRNFFSAGRFGSYKRLKREH